MHNGFTPSAAGWRAGAEADRKLAPYALRKNEGAQDHRKPAFLAHGMAEGW
uniref:HMG box domain-containing protein n=1 Tax=Ascaris lumbricoides TaxID=6252 RepID=A0A0M3HF54_ASCLU